MNEMTEKCFDIGTIQAFLDGELDSERLAQVAHHVAACDDCARLLAEAENEFALVFAAFDTEINSLVPTERIRTNLYEQIAKEKKSFWKRIFGESFSWTNPAVAAFASLALIAGIFTTLFVVRENRTPIAGEVAKIEQPKFVETQNPDKRILPLPVDNPAGEAPIKSTASRVEKATSKSNHENRAVVQNADYRPLKVSVKKQSSESVADSSAPPKNEGLIGEENYVKTIATLDETVNSQKDEILRPSARVAFEKDLAVVNDSIDKMQKEVRNHPKNEAAKELLRSAYQNKIDLLNSVADKGAMMATLK